VITQSGIILTTLENCIKILAHCVTQLWLGYTLVRVNSTFHGILVCSVTYMARNREVTFIYFTHDNLHTFECIPCKTDAPRYMQPCPLPLPHYQSSTDTPAVHHLPLPTQKPRLICQNSPLSSHMSFTLNAWVNTACSFTIYAICHSQSMAQQSNMTGIPCCL